MASALDLEFDFRNQRFSDASRGLNVFADRLGKSLDDAPKVISKELRDYLDTVAEALARRHSGGWPGGTTQNTMSRRSGFMIESIKESVTVSGNTIDTVVGTISVPRERKIHEHGGVIKARNVKYLTIPLPAALDSSGIPLKKSARDWKDTFVIKSKAGNLLIVRKKGLGIEPLYLLKTEVYIPPRLGLGETLNLGQSMLVDRMADAILRSLRGS